MEQQASGDVRWPAAEWSGGGVEQKPQSHHLPVGALFPVGPYAGEAFIFGRGLFGAAVFLCFGFSVFN